MFLSWQRKAYTEPSSTGKGKTPLLEHQCINLARSADRFRSVRVDFIAKMSTSVWLSESVVARDPASNRSARPVSLCSADILMIHSHLAIARDLRVDSATIVMRLTLNTL